MNLWLSFDGGYGRFIWCNCLQASNKRYIIEACSK